MIEGGPQALQTLQDLKRKPRRRDYGPRLHWEQPIWSWFERLAMGAPGHVDRWSWLMLIERQHWHMETAFHLLSVIEAALIPKTPAPS